MKSLFERMRAQREELRRKHEENISKLTDWAQRAHRTGHPVVIAAGRLDNRDVVTVEIQPDGSIQIRRHRSNDGLTWNSETVQPYDVVMDEVHGEPEPIEW